MSKLKPVGNNTICEPSLGFLPQPARSQRAAYLGRIRVPEEGARMDIPKRRRCLSDRRLPVSLSSSSTPSIPSERAEVHFRFSQPAVTRGPVWSLPDDTPVQALVCADTGGYDIELAHPTQPHTVVGSASGKVWVYSRVKRDDPATSGDTIDANNETASPVRGAKAASPEFTSRLAPPLSSRGYLDPLVDPTFSHRKVLVYDPGPSLEMCRQVSPSLPPPSPCLPPLSPSQSAATSPSPSSQRVPLRAPPPRPSRVSRLALQRERQIRRRWPTMQRVRQSSVSLSPAETETAGERKFHYVGGVSGGRRHGWGRLLDDHHTIFEGSWRHGRCDGWFLAFHEFYVEMGFQSPLLRTGVLVLGDTNCTIVPFTTNSDCSREMTSRRRRRVSVPRSADFIRGDVDWSCRREVVSASVPTQSPDPFGRYLSPQHRAARKASLPDSARLSLHPPSPRDAIYTRPPKSPWNTRQQRSSFSAWNNEEFLPSDHQFRDNGRDGDGDGGDRDASFNFMEKRARRLSLAGDALQIPQARKTCNSSFSFLEAPRVCHSRGSRAEVVSFTAAPEDGDRRDKERRADRRHRTSFDVPKMSGLTRFGESKRARVNSFSLHDSRSIHFCERQRDDKSTYGDVKSIYGDGKSIYADAKSSFGDGMSLSPLFDSKVLRERRSGGDESSQQFTIMESAALSTSSRGRASVFGLPMSLSGTSGRPGSRRASYPGASSRLYLRAVTESSLFSVAQRMTAEEPLSSEESLSAHRGLLSGALARGSDLPRWDVNNVSDFLVAVGAYQVVPLFREHHVTGRHLPSLDAELFRRLGVQDAHCISFLLAAFRYLWNALDWSDALLLPIWRHAHPAVSPAPRLRFVDVDFRRKIGIGGHAVVWKGALSKDERETPFWGDRALSAISVSASAVSVSAPAVSVSTPPVSVSACPTSCALKVFLNTRKDRGVSFQNFLQKLRCTKLPSGRLRIPSAPLPRLSPSENGSAVGDAVFLEMASSPKSKSTDTTVDDAEESPSQAPPTSLGLPSPSPFGLPSPSPFASEAEASSASSAAGPVSASLRYITQWIRRLSLSPRATKNLPCITIAEASTLDVTAFPVREPVAQQPGAPALSPATTPLSPSVTSHTVQPPSSVVQPMKRSVSHRIRDHELTVMESLPPHPHVLQYDTHTHIHTRALPTIIPEHWDILKLVLKVGLS
eukprot:Gregarina_sp_Poly_1__10616@NODE_795_length_6258_cov_47_262478_g36_i1_p1_GENE_NODE_795_length_6258_cov_47_262478_g36_i1NODE_795_length_6258_cov_47_262478_g36_i1_p1_ORF_typecomplete_len1188_score215_29SAM_2/PF07647_17/1_3e07SAM_1/PF00536_30/1_6e05_NODE_795_length_6258_cov_47_262478_g36_i1213584